ncbi:mannose-1-phosphate guanylyltransferase/mannose-6-phosphate isomerase [Avibacterium volantium]|uniref:mannose-1-phosphate guanylyltransferase/mannose-6-phosphate isomerase n=1 Tax=Avibacterium TaxID=292486 RepID=UPI0039FC5D8B
MLEYNNMENEDFSVPIYPVILAGGTGSRLWPLSRESYPKQFLKFGNNELSMLQTTIKRLEKIKNCQPPLVICNDAHRFIVKEQLREIGETESSIILEPFGKNTAPAAALASFYLTSKNKSAIILILAADHFIQDMDTFCDTINTYKNYTEKNILLTFGIKPNKPETGYGYIKKGDYFYKNSFLVEKFVEKPNYQIAQEYINSGRYFWNSGIFMFTAQTYLDELKKYRPDIYDVCKLSINDAIQDDKFIRIKDSSYENCPQDSIDYAVMERTKKSIVIPIDIGWNDVGSWSSLWDISEKNNDGNVLQGDIITLESNNNYIFSEHGVISTVGIKDLIIIQTKDVLLIAEKDSTQKIKQVVERLDSLGKCKYK